MKNKIIILILFAALFLVSCSTVKKTTEATAKSKGESITDISKDVQSNEETTTSDKSTLNKEKAVEKTIDKIEKETGKLEGTLKTYDTSLPLDPLTGLPPLQSELTFSNMTTLDNEAIQSEKSNVNSGKANDLKTAIQKGLDVKINEKQETKIQTAEALQTTETRKTNNLWWIIMLVTGGCGAAFFFIKKIPFVLIFTKAKELLIKLKNYIFK